MVSALDSLSSGRVQALARVIVLILGKHYSHTASLHAGVQKRTDKFSAVIFDLSSFNVRG